MNELKFLKGQSSKWSTISKNQDYFYLVINDDTTVDFYLGDKIIAKGKDVQSLIDEIKRAKAEEQRIEGLTTVNKDAITLLNANADTVGSVDYKVKAETDRAKGEEKKINDQVTLNKDAIAVLNGGTEVEGSVSKKIADAVSAVIDGAPEAFDTFKEIADWITKDESGTTALVARVAKNESSIKALQEADTAIRGEFAAADAQIIKDYAAADLKLDTEYKAADAQIRKDYAAADKLIDDAYKAADTAIRSDFAKADSTTLDSAKGYTDSKVVEINASIKTTDDKVNTLRTEYDAHVTAQTKTIETINQGISTLTNNLGTLDSKVDAEIKRSTEKDTALESSLAKEVEARKAMKGSGNVSVESLPDDNDKKQTVKLTWLEF